MILYIDTTDNDLAEIALVKPEVSINERWQSLPHAEEFPQAIKNFLKKHNLSFSDVSKIAVKVGPGFFSRVRTGVVAANALAYALGVKVVPVENKFEYAKVFKSKGLAQVLPKYGAKPNITKPKKRL